jgi:hypothetical protein
LIQFALIAQVGFFLSYVPSPHVFAEFCYWNSEKQLKWKFIYKESDANTRKNIAEQKGVRTSILDRLPTWNGALSIPSEIMHLFWGPGVSRNSLTGASGQIHRVILIEGSMFTGTGKWGEITPMDRLTEFLESLWWPNNSGWFQIKVTLIRASNYDTKL